jgi:hypothetical protein
MNHPKVNDIDYIQFLIAEQRVFTCTEGSGLPTDATELNNLETIGSKKSKRRKGLKREPTRS